MLKLTFCLRRLPSLSLAAFQGFIDLARSPLWLNREHVVHAGAGVPA